MLFAANEEAKKYNNIRNIKYSTSKKGKHKNKIYI